ncbi:MAG: hypothetical protein JNL97_03005 [Verrucomicrobiales bacterium]|nr:hypothetical protein [Verrucomicrobiales bacterium]
MREHAGQAKDTYRVNDYFECLGERRLPWLEPEDLKERFLRISGPWHPDRHHGADDATRREAGERYAALNTAYQALREPRTRLSHLLELEAGSKPKDIQRIPPGTMDLFVEVGQVCRDVDGFLAERSGVSSPMLKVRLFRQGMEWVERLKALQAKVSAKERELGDEVRGMNGDWEGAPPPGDSGRPGALPLARLEEIYRVLSYAARWTGQIQERLVQLATG